MDNFIQDFSNLSISKKKSKKQANKGPKTPVSVLHIPSTTKVVVKPSVLNINKARLSHSHYDADCEKVNTALTYIYLNSYDDEFIDIQNIFEEENLLVLCVRKVDNPYLKKAFELARHLKYEGKNPKKLFHGTKDKYVDNICTYNFDWRLSGCEKGHRHGKGVNFSRSPYFSTYFCDKGNKPKVMIMADVLVNEVHEGDINMVVPPKGFDTTSGKNGKILVKFYDNEFFPRYVIDFERMH